MIPEPNELPDNPQQVDLVLDANTVDLSLDDSGAIDLQALADEAADATPEYMVVMDDEESAELEPILLDPEVPASTATAEDYQRQLARAHSQIGEVEKREADVLDHYKRLKAEYLNYRDRSARDTQVALNQGDRKLLLEILPVLDNFERSLDATYPDMEAFRSGVELIRKQFLDALRRVGVESVGLNVGDPFDALHAEALTTMSNGDLADGAVAAIYERGYTLRGQLLRPARVVVNHNPDADTNPGGEPKVFPEANPMAPEPGTALE